jgi:UDP-N-acetyl-D-mannosaminuronic acid dehydrogenase
MSRDILVIGLGEIGYHNAQYITSLGLKVDGYDINYDTTRRAINNGIISNAATDFHDYNYYLICISTHNPSNIYTPQLDGLYNIAQKISLEGKTDSLVGIESTIPLGTSNKIIEILNHRLHVAHFPHRFYKNEKKTHGVKQIRVLGGCDSCCLEIAESFYGELLKIPLHIVDAIKYAELSKLIENSYRYLKIAFAEELYITSDYLNLDFQTLREAVNTKWNVEILEARNGIDGHCLPKDSDMYLELIKDSSQYSLIETAKQIDKSYRNHLEDKLLLKSAFDLLIHSVQHSKIMD